jgi:membrane protein YqaA with SNARE-associated domain
MRLCIHQEKLKASAYFVNGKNMLIDLSLYVALFVTAFAAATVLPVQSEAALAALLVAGDQPVAALLAVATLGNTLGAVLNWWLGGRLSEFQNRKWFPVSAESLSRARNWYGSFGRWSLLMSWVPIIGDALTVAAGLMRERLLPFILIVGLAKFTRYVVVAAAVLGVFGRQ